MFSDARRLSVQWHLPVPVRMKPYSFIGALRGRCSEQMTNRLVILLVDLRIDVVFQNRQILQLERLIHVDTDHFRCEEISNGGRLWKHAFIWSPKVRQMSGGRSDSEDEDTSEVGKPGCDFLPASRSPKQRWKIETSRCKAWSYVIRCCKMLKSRSGCKVCCHNWWFQIQILEPMRWC